MKNESLSLTYRKGAVLKPIIAFLLSSITILFMPLFSRESDEMVMNILALTFWLLLIAGIIFTVLISKSIPCKKVKSKGCPRILRFFKTKQTRVIDTAFVISITLVIFTNVFHFNSSWIQFLLIFLSLFTIELHCVCSLIDTSNVKRDMKKN